MRAWLPPFFYALLIFAASTVPSSAMPRSEVLEADKVLHAIEYAVLGALLFRALWLGTLWAGAACGALASLVASLIGCLDECYQLLTPGRFASAYDAAADAVGAGFGVALAWTWYWRNRDGDDSQFSRQGAGGRRRHLRR